MQESSSADKIEIIKHNYRSQKGSQYNYEYISVFAEFNLLIGKGVEKVVFVTVTPVKTNFKQHIFEDARSVFKNYYSTKIVQDITF